MTASLLNKLEVLGKTEFSPISNSLKHRTVEIYGHFIFHRKNINTKVMVRFEPMLNELHVEAAEQETNLFTFILSRKAYQEVLTMLNREI